MIDETEFQLDDWTVRPERSTIERDDKEIHIKPKSMAVLGCLADAGGSVVARETLFNTVWPGVVVTDDALTQCIVELRKAFGDTAHDARYIETIPKKGFRLLPEVRPLTERQPDSGEPASRPARQKSVLMIPILGAAVVGILLYWFQATTTSERNRTLAVEDTQTLAVLPFVDMSPSGDQEYFTDGLSEELLNRLGGLSNLQLSGRTSSFYFKDKDADLQQISEALNVGHVLEGSVRKSGDKLRITATLIDTSNGFQLWSESYERNTEEIFAIQDDISESVAMALSITLSVGELGAVVGGTSNIEAYTEVLLGTAQYRIYSPESLLLAIDHFNRAVDLDPEYALGWERIADVYTTARFILEGETTENWAQLSGEAIDRALKLAPDSIAINHTAAFRLTHLEQWREAHLLFDRIKEMNGGEDINKSTFLADVGRAPDSLEIMLREHQRDPLSGIWD